MTSSSFLRNKGLKYAYTTTYILKKQFLNLVELEVLGIRQAEQSYYAFTS